MQEGATTQIVAVGLLDGVKSDPQRDRWRRTDTPQRPHNIEDDQSIRQSIWPLDSWPQMIQKTTQSWFPGLAKAARENQFQAYATKCKLGHRMRTFKQRLPPIGCMHVIIKLVHVYLADVAVMHWVPSQRGPVQLPAPYLCSWEDSDDCTDWKPIGHNWWIQEFNEWSGWDSSTAPQAQQTPDNRYYWPT
jgi:hypothetical protein